MKRMLIVLLVLLLLCGCTQKAPAASSGPEIPYEEMNEQEKSAVSRIQNGDPGTDGDPFRTAVMISGVCYYGYPVYEENQELPAGAKYVGELLEERSEACTTPTQHLQAEQHFLSAKSVEVYLYDGTPYFLMDKEKVVIFTDVTTEAPPYYNDGRWMLEAPKTE